MIKTLFTPKLVKILENKDQHVVGYFFFRTDLGKKFDEKNKAENEKEGKEKSLR